ncbi:hypothetical protein E7Y31_02920 [Candidatus Frankia alpina]|uniref:Uncharacterized protein n=1 Tax=Candidatus Frankia alpina TaxID=2699483 RepID=A0A4S5ETT0_9ACTN|nr:hypothetical protein E7Y31_02920 [Candidatus Frankia alpina]
MGRPGPLADRVVASAEPAEPRRRPRSRRRPGSGAGRGIRGDPSPARRARSADRHRRRGV